MKATFIPEITTIGRISATQVEIAAEPMVHSADLPFMARNSGPVSARIAGAIADSGVDMSTLIAEAPEDYAIVFDTKKVLLQPGQYPCIPGWHCDAIERGDNGQPALHTLHQNPGFHVVCTVGGDGTEFVDNQLTVEYDEDRVWGSVNEAVEDDVHHRIRQLDDGEIAFFSPSTLHRGPQATKRSWRFFFRMSLMKTTPQNKIRTQVQVYADPNKGW